MTSVGTRAWGFRLFAGSIAVVVGLVAGPAASATSRAAGSRGDWVEDGYDSANTRFNPLEKTLGPANVAQLTPLWNLDIDANSSPVVAGHRVYVQTLTAVNAYDRVTGDLAWSHPLASDLFSGSIAVADDVVYAVSNPDTTATPVLYALAAADGAQLWKRKVPAAAAGRAIVVAGGSVYVPAVNAVVVVDAVAHTAHKLVTTGGQTSRVAIDAGRIFVASDGGELFAFDAATRHLDWHITDDSKRNDGFPTAANGIVYESAGSGRLVAVSEADGSPRWSIDAHTKFTSDVALAKGVVYFGDYTGRFSALNATTGKQKWTVSLGAQATDEPTIANGVVYVTTQDKNLRALDARTGASLFTGSAGAISQHNVVVSNGNVFLSGATGRLRRFVLPG